MSYTDAIEQKQPLQKPLVASLLLHGSVSMVVLFWGYLHKTPDRFGDPNSNAGPGSVLTTPTIPLPGRTGPRNPVANDTEAQTEARPAPREKAAEPDDPDAIALDKKKSRTKDREKKTVASVPYRPKRDYDPTKLYSERGGRMVDNAYSMKGAGGVGLGVGNVFGTRFGAYAQLLQQRVAEKWRTEDINTARNTATVVVVAFEILRSGEVRNIQVVQKSGNYALDASAQRAIREASPFPPLPQGFERNSATVEFDFQYKR